MIGSRLTDYHYKTTFILFCSHRKFVLELTPLILIENRCIHQSKSVKFLSVIVDQHLSWNEHIAQISAKFAKNIGILSHISYKIPAHIPVNLYYSLTYPYLTYCNMIWSSTYTSCLTHLVILQKKQFAYSLNLRITPILLPYFIRMAFLI